jgi:peptidoglycan/LPS O-acetylase OafA/YrhL
MTATLSLDLSGTPGEHVEAPAQRQAPPTEGRDRYIDTLRAGALVRIVLYQVFGFAWLPFLFPSMGVMFALAGGLMAASLDRAEHNPWRVLKKRTIRLLPPLWMLGLVLVPVMMAHGWVAVREEGGVPLDATALLSWIVPLGDPGASDWGYPFTTLLWYIRAYFWFLLLSPALLFLFRRWPRRTMSVPLTIAVLSGVGVFGFDLQGETQSSAIMATMATFGACWLVGFAHHDGLLRNLSLRWVVPVSVSLILVGAWWTATRRDWELGDDTLGQALYCFGFVLLLLRFYPSFAWLQRRPFLDKLITVINHRAMTIYLWSTVAIFLAGGAAASPWTPAVFQVTDAAFTLSTFALTWVLLGVAVLAFGWVEDIAARRPPRLNPWPSHVTPSHAISDAPLRRGRTALVRATPRHRMAGALVMLSLAGGVAVYWAVSDHGSLVPNVPATTEGGGSSITALKEAAPPAAAERSAARDDEGSGEGGSVTVVDGDAQQDATTSNGAAEAGADDGSSAQETGEAPAVAATEAPLTGATPSAALPGGPGAVTASGTSAPGGTSDGGAVAAGAGNASSDTGGTTSPGTGSAPGTGSSSGPGGSPDPGTAVPDPGGSDGTLGPGGDEPSTEPEPTVEPEPTPEPQPSLMEEILDFVTNPFDGTGEAEPAPATPGGSAP